MTVNLLIECFEMSVYYYYYLIITFAYFFCEWIVHQLLYVVELVAYKYCNALFDVLMNGIITFKNSVLAHNQ